MSHHGFVNKPLERALSCATCIGCAGRGYQVNWAQGPIARSRNDFAQIFERIPITVPMRFITVSNSMDRGLRLSPRHRRRCAAGRPGVKIFGFLEAVATGLPQRCRARKSAALAQLAASLWGLVMLFFNDHRANPG